MKNKLSPTSTFKIKISTQKIDITEEASREYLIYLNYLVRDLTTTLNIYSNDIAIIESVSYKSFSNNFAKNFRILIKNDSTTNNLGAIFDYSFEIVVSEGVIYLSTILGSILLGQVGDLNLSTIFYNYELESLTPNTNEELRFLAKKTLYSTDLPLSTHSYTLNSDTLKIVTEALELIRTGKPATLIISSKLRDKNLTVRTNLDFATDLAKIFSTILEEENKAKHKKPESTESSVILDESNDLTPAKNKEGSNGPTNTILGFEFETRGDTNITCTTNGNNIISCKVDPLISCKVDPLITSKKDTQQIQIVRDYIAPGIWLMSTGVFLYNFIKKWYNIKSKIENTTPNSTPGSNSVPIPSQSKSAPIYDNDNDYLDWDIYGGRRGSLSSVKSRAPSEGGVSQANNNRGRKSFGSLTGSPLKVINDAVSSTSKAVGNLKSSSRAPASEKFAQVVDFVEQITKDRTCIQKFSYSQKIFLYSTEPHTTEDIVRILSIDHATGPRFYARYIREIFGNQGPLHNLLYIKNFPSVFQKYYDQLRVGGVSQRFYDKIESTDNGILAVDNRNSREVSISTLQYINKIMEDTSYRNYHHVKSFIIMVSLKAVSEITGVRALENIEINNKAIVAKEEEIKIAEELCFKSKEFTDEEAEECYSLALDNIEAKYSKIITFNIASDDNIIREYVVDANEYECIEFVKEGVITSTYQIISDSSGAITFSEVANIYDAEFMNCKEIVL